MRSIARQRVIDEPTSRLFLKVPWVKFGRGHFSGFLVRFTGSDFHISRAARIILGGGIIAYPTEGVWGLGCDPFDDAAVFRILQMKQRRVSKGLILIASNTEQLTPALSDLNKNELDQLRRDFGYPITWLVPDNGVLPYWITGGADTVAVRISKHPGVAALCERLGSAMVSTSANPGGRPAARNALRVRQYFNRDLDYVFPGRLQSEQGASEIRHLRSGQIIRPRGS